MPSRVIRSEINVSRSLSRVSPFAELAFRALLLHVDDYGRCEADPLMLKAGLFARRPEFTPEMVRGWMDELAAEGCVRFYEVDGIEYLKITDMQRYVAGPPPEIIALRTAISNRRSEIVSALISRDGEGCRACGSDGPLHIDHRVPVSRGGTNDLENLQLLCSACNLSKGARTHEEWIERRAVN